MYQTYGYIRVSTKEQNETRQIDALMKWGVSKNKIFTDKQSGKDFNRPQWSSLMKTIKCGDLIVVKSIDRLGRDYNEILNQWQSITKHKKCHICVIDMPLLDTRTEGKDLTCTFIADLVLQILSYVAQTERESIKARQAEGIASAKARGVCFGRPRIDMPKAFNDIYLRWKSGELSSRKAAKILGISHMTFYRRCCEMVN